MEADKTSLTEIRYAGFWIRFAAYLLDCLVLVAFSTLLSTLLGLNWTNNTPGLNLVELIVNILYFVILTSIYGQTLGKMALGIKVIRQDGKPNSWGPILLRETIGKLFSTITILFGYIMAAFDSKKRALHDRIADTYVIIIND